MLSRRMQFLEDAFKSITSLSEQIRASREEASTVAQQLYEQVQQIFGVAAVDVPSDADPDVVVARKGKTLVLFYPMVKDERGRTLMNAKLVDPVTAALRLVPVCVFDPAASTPRRVHSFSATGN
jgi:hypothetical protein